MKLEPPLSNLISRCQTICVADCCGRDAYDFSPVQIASYLTMWLGLPSDSDIGKLREQIETLRANYGLDGSSFKGATIEEMNQNFSAGQIEDLATELLSNMEIALEVINLSELKRYKESRTSACSQ